MVNVVQINTKSREKMWKTNMYSQWGGSSAAVRDLWNGSRGPLIPSILRIRNLWSRQMGPPLRVA